MLNNTSDLIAWVQTVPPQPGKDPVNASVLYNFRISICQNFWKLVCFNFSHRVTVRQINTY